MFVAGQFGCISVKMVVFGQSGCIRAEVFVFGQKWLQLGISSFILALLLYSSKTGCIRTKWLYSDKSG